MKFLDYLFHGKELRYIDSYFKMLNGYSPTFTSYNGGVYEMDLTRTAVNSFATHCSKLKPEIEGSALKSLEKTLQHKPNYFMDTTKFIKRLATYVAVEHTAFIIPIEDEYGRLCGWYPLRAQRCEVVEAAGQVYLRYLFANGEHGAIEFERVRRSSCRGRKKGGYGILLRRGSGRYEICSGRRIRHGAGSNTYPDRRGSGSRRGGKRQNSPYTFQSGKSRLQGNCAGTHRHRGRNDNRRHCSTERSIKAV